MFKDKEKFLGISILISSIIISIALLFNGYVAMTNDRYYFSDNIPRVFDKKTGNIYFSNGNILNYVDNTMNRRGPIKDITIE